MELCLRKQHKARLARFWPDASDNLGSDVRVFVVIILWELSVSQFQASFNIYSLLNDIHWLSFESEIKKKKPEKLPSLFQYHLNQPRNICIKTLNRHISPCRLTLSFFTLLFVFIITIVAWCSTFDNHNWKRLSNGRVR